MARRELARQRPYHDLGGVLQPISDLGNPSTSYFVSLPIVLWLIGLHWQYESGIVLHAGKQKCRAPTTCCTANWVLPLFIRFPSGSPCDPATCPTMAAVRTKPCPESPMAWRGALIPPPIRHISLVSRTFYSVKRPHGRPERVQPNLPSDDVREKVCCKIIILNSAV